MAFQELIRPHLEALRRFVFSLSSSWQDADDIAQEALIKAFRAFSTYDERATLSTWLYTVARSACIDWHRSRLGRAARRENPLDDVQPAQRDAADDACAHKQEHEQLWSAIRQLPEHARVPLVLFDIEGLTYEEISTIEDVPVGTVRSRLSRARQQLRQLLLDEDPKSGVSVIGASNRAVPSVRRFHG